MANPNNEWVKSLPPASPVMSWAAVVMMIAFAIAALWYVSAYSGSVGADSYKSFSVIGEGKAIAVPDVARFTFGVVSETSSADVAALQVNNTTKMNRVIAALKAAGIADKDIKTESYNLSPRYTSCYREEGICPPSQIAGYRLEQIVSVKVRDFTKVGSILSQTVAAGANNISQVEFTVDDLEAVRNTARAEAIARARAQAKAMAKAGGFRVGELLSVEEGGPFPYPIYGKGGSISAAMPMDMVESAPQPALEPGSTEVTVNVVLRYEIK